MSEKTVTLSLNEMLLIAAAVGLFENFINTLDNLPKEVIDSMKKDIETLNNKITRG